MSPPVRRYQPDIIVGLVISSILVVSYSSVILQAATTTTPKVTWTTSPLSISFSAATGSGSKGDFFTCIPSIGFVSVRAVNSNPSKISVRTTPSSFSSCGSSIDSLVVTVTCLVPAASCKGSYTGTIQIRQPENYRNLASPLSVAITVT